MVIRIERKGPVRCLIPESSMDGMRVPGLIYADGRILSEVRGDPVLQQVANVACLPGIIGYSFAMPDLHWGYGFPIGGVAAFARDEGVVSPGGVGYDISCGVRLHVSRLEEEEVRPVLPALLDALYSSIPCGVGSEGLTTLKGNRLNAVLKGGAAWAARNGFGEMADLDRIEHRGCLDGADPEMVSQKAKDRGNGQLGSLGSGNHFLEIQRIDEIFDPTLAHSFGLEPGRVTVMIHCGSRGLGHQVCDDHLRFLSRSVSRRGIEIPDRQLACAPIGSEEGRAYLGAMQAAANFALANREAIGSRVREVFSRFFPDESLELLYDVSHNMALMEKHVHEGKEGWFCVHRKGATRALPPGHPGLPQAFVKMGQPVIIPGSMGTASYVLAGAQGASECFCSTCHGAGRLKSRSAARKAADSASVVAALGAKGILVRAGDLRTLGEEAPEAYKDVDLVVDVVEKAGLSRKVARLRPLAVIKG
jgi:tRNA-splicing ligase RtcB